MVKPSMQIALVKSSTKDFVTGNDQQCSMSDLPSPMLSTAFNDLENTASPLVR